MIIENKSKYLVQSMGTLSAPVVTPPEENKISSPKGPDSLELLNKFEKNYPIGNSIYQFEFDGLFTQEPRMKFEFSEEYWNEVISKYPDMEMSGIPGDILKPSSVITNVKNIDKEGKNVIINFEFQFFPPYYEGVNSYFGQYVYMSYAFGFDYFTKEYHNFGNSENKFYINNEDIFGFYKNNLIEKIIFINENNQESELSLSNLEESGNRLIINNFFDDFNHRTGTRFDLKFILK